MGTLFTGSCLTQLIATGVDIEALNGRGYRLRRPIERLDEQQLRNRLRRRTRDRLAGLEIVPSIDSTNAHLLRRAAEGTLGRRVCLAERQTAGRGRQGRRWVSPFGANIYLSILWRFPAWENRISALSLLVALRLVQHISSLGEARACVKWPNDLIGHHKKFGGVLLETLITPGGPCYVVVGVGINVKMSARDGSTIDQPWTDLDTLLASHVPPRNELAAGLIDTLFDTVSDFEREKLSGLSDRWRPYDYALGKAVELRTTTGTWHGTAVGIDELGHFLLDVDGEQHAFASGEISLRVRP